MGPQGAVLDACSFSGPTASGPSMSSLLSEDVPPPPKRLSRDASEEEREERALVMAKRRRMQKALHEQTRDRSNRDRAKDASGFGNRRVARHIFREARCRPLPRVTASTHDELVNLTNAYEAATADRCAQGWTTNGGWARDRAFWHARDQIKEAWEAVLQRTLPKQTSEFSINAQGDPEVDHGPRVAHLVRRGPTEHELTYGLYSRGRLISGAIHCFTDSGLVSSDIGVWGFGRPADEESVYVTCPVGEQTMREERPFRYQLQVCVAGGESRMSKVVECSQWLVQNTQ